MLRKKEPEAQVFSGDTDEWYTAGEAAKVLSTNSKRKVGAEYPYKLGAMQKVRTKKIGPRVTLYHKQDIDRYVVEPRGTRSGNAKREKAGIEPGHPTVRQHRRQAQPKQEHSAEGII